MTFEDLLRARSIERVATAPEDIRMLLDVDKRDIRTAQGIIDTDLDWAFAIAYNAVLQVSIAYMAHLGFRPRGEGLHYNTFRFMEIALRDDHTAARRLQKLRRKRNVTLYGQAGAISETEAADIIDFAIRYVREVTSRLPPEVRGDYPSSS